MKGAPTLTEFLSGLLSIKVPCITGTETPDSDYHLVEYTYSPLDGHFLIKDYYDGSSYASTDSFTPEQATKFYESCLPKQSEHTA